MNSTPESGQSIPPDVALSAIADEKRRAVLRALDHTEGNTMELDTLVDRIAERVRVNGGEPPADDHRQRVRTVLHHVHLPKLEACGMIVYATETGEVRSVSGELERELLRVLESYEGRE